MEEDFLKIQLNVSFSGAGIMFILGPNKNKMEKNSTDRQTGERTDVRTRLVNINYNNLQS